MPPALASLLTAAFISFLFFLETRKQTEVNSALWLPVLWMIITGSRFPTQWLNLGARGADADGGVLDVIYFLTLIILGGRVLIARKIEISKLIANNHWIAAFFIFGFLSIAWSDFPFVAFKRYIKVLGHPIMALIILTDADPKAALRIVMKRSAYLLMPLSVLFIKYYPEYGRGFDSWTGEAFNNGVMLNKNELGYSCMLFGIFFFWNILTAKYIEDPKIRRYEILISAVFLYMICWLLSMAHSSTSLVSFLVGVSVIAVVGSKLVSKKYLGTYVITTVVVAVSLESAFDIREMIFDMLGEDSTLTDRTFVWADCLALVENPILGTGFESFWLGERLDILWAKWWWKPNQAHNGYIETYLNLGLIGVILLIGMIISAFRKSGRQSLTDLAMGRLRLGFLFAIVFYNYAEATFKAVHLVWTVFHIIAIEYPTPAVILTTLHAKGLSRNPAQSRYKKANIRKPNKPREIP